MLSSAWVGAVLTLSCLCLRRHKQHSPGDAASAAVLEKMRVVFTLLSREEKKCSLIIQILQEGALLGTVHVSIWGSVK